MAAKKIDYPALKKALWEAWRNFLPPFLLVVVAQFQLGVDLREWQNWLPSLLISAGTAGLKAVIKWFRETYGDGDYTKLIYKLPL